MIVDLQGTASVCRGKPARRHTDRRAQNPFCSGAADEENGLSPLKLLSTVDATRRTGSEPVHGHGRVQP